MPSRQPPTQASRADQGQGDKVVRPVGRSTLSPWPWPAPPRCGSAADGMAVEALAGRAPDSGTAPRDRGRYPASNLEKRF